MPRKSKPKEIDLEAKRRAGLKGGAATKRKMLRKDKSYYSNIAKMRSTFAGGRPKRKRGARGKKKTDVA